MSGFLLEHVLAVVQEFTGSWFDEPSEDACRRALAGTGLADEGNDLAAWDGEGDILQRVDVSFREQPANREALCQVPDFHHVVGRRFGDRVGFGLDLGRHQDFSSGSVCR
jgi:hypothetical protein